MDDQALYEVDDAATLEVLGMAGAYFETAVPLSNEKVMALFERAKLQEENNPGVEEALVWADDYEIALEVIRADEARF